MDVDKRLGQLNFSFSNFFSVANLGDTNSAYRGRPIWTNCEIDEVCNSTERLLEEVPVSRNAAIYFISNLMHENVHLFFLEKERKEGNIPAKAVDYSSLEKAVRRLIAKLSEFREEMGDNSAFSLTLLDALFELCAELYRRNTHRPIFSRDQQRQTATNVFLRAFEQIPCIRDLFSLLDTTFYALLSSNSLDKAMFLFASAHKKYFASFEWVILHITEAFPPGNSKGNFVELLMKMGTDEFHAHCAELSDPNFHSNAKRAEQLQDEYKTRLQLFCDIFRYIEQNRRVELRNYLLSIVENFANTGENGRELVFIVKLALNQPEIVLPFSEELLRLIIYSTFIIDRVIQLTPSPTFAMAVTPPGLVQKFFQRLVKEVSTDAVFSIYELVSAYPNAQLNSNLHH